MAVTAFPGEIYRAPRSCPHGIHGNLTYFNEVNDGGHFAAREELELFNEELRAEPRNGFGLDAIQCSALWRAAISGNLADAYDTQRRQQ